MQAYPLSWPQGWKRTSRLERKNGQFNRKEREYRPSPVAGGQGYSFLRTKNLSIADGVARILETLERMGVSRNDVIISTNVRTRLDGLPRSGEKEPDDPGAAVYWRASYNAPARCMAIDRYTVVADNLAAIAATLEAMRAIERHGGAEILDRAFTGFAALPDPNRQRPWWEVLGTTENASRQHIEDQYRQLARQLHPDAGGTHEAMAELNAAREAALKEVR